MFCPPGYVPLSSASVDFFEWVRDLVERSIAYEDKRGLSEKTSIELNDYCTRLSVNRLKWYLDYCRSTSMCSPLGVLLTPDKLRFFCDTTDYWGQHWFPKEYRTLDMIYMYIETETFTVTASFWNNVLSGLVRKNMPDDWPIFELESQTIAKFEGWSICISDDDYLKIKDFIVEDLDLNRNVLSDLLGTEVSTNHRSTGRPPLKKARDEFALLGYDKGKRSWEQMAQYLEKRTGEKPAPKTLRTWAADGQPAYPPSK
jgi:hypothetical protein